MSISIIAGNTVRCTVVFVPETGTVALVDVSARVLEERTGTVTALAPVETATNTFHADIAVPDGVGGGKWIVRFESNAPSAKIAIEDESTTFHVVRSALPTP